MLSDLVYLFANCHKYLQEYVLARLLDLNSDEYTCECFPRRSCTNTLTEDVLWSRLAGGDISMTFTLRPSLVLYLQLPQVNLVGPLLHQRPLSQRLQFYNQMCRESLRLLQIHAFESQHTAPASGIQSRTHKSNRKRL